jgi:hypothetical protein
MVHEEINFCTLASICLQAFRKNVRMFIQYTVPVCLSVQRLQSVCLDQRSQAEESDVPPVKSDHHTSSFPVCTVQETHYSSKAGQH